MTLFLELDDLLYIAEQATGGQPLIRDIGLLESALARSRATVFGADAYPELHEKAAALLHSLVCIHALVDGNKRLGWAACAVFLGLNGARVVAGQPEVVELVVAAADGTLDDVAAIAERLRRL